MEVAEQGTILLEDVDALPPSAQHRLLRCIQEKAVERFGGSRAMPCEARILLTTRMPLADLAREGRFREDLFYRIQGVTVSVPPLRERREDVSALIKHFLTQGTGEGGRAPTLSPRADTILREYRWPGNVAELQSAIERRAAIANGDMVTEAELPANIRQSVTGGGESGLMDQVESVERQMVLDALMKHGWNQTHAAAALKMGRTSLQYKMQKHKLVKPGK
jgi:DNA-binding NtrC family response regulator